MPLPWWTVDGGGGTLGIEGGYTLSGSIGQPDAGALASNDHMLSGGFWGGGKLAAVFKIYLPLVQRDFWPPETAGVRTESRLDEPEGVEAWDLRDRLSWLH
jgi:hypothetical protein